MGAMLLGVVEGHPLLQIRSRKGKLSEPGEDLPQHAVGFQEECRVLRTLRQAKELSSEIPCCL
jgi:hypothetical protein